MALPCQSEPFPVLDAVAGLSLLQGMREAVIPGQDLCFCAQDEDRELLGCLSLS